MNAEDPADGSLFAAAHSDSEYRNIGVLNAPYAEITQHIMGIRRYWGGYIYADGFSRDVFGSLSTGSCWVVWAGVFMRIHGAGNSSLGPGGRPWRIACSQRRQVGWVHIGYESAGLDLIEPSPPAPPEQWWASERARAVRELFGARPSSETALVPGMRGDFELIKPWEVAE